MRRSRKSANPFYVLLIVAGLSFAMTATVYVVMAVREAHPYAEAIGAAPTVARDEHPLMQWMRHHGNAALLTELGLLAICTFAAIGTDSYWQRRADVRRS